MQQKSFKNIFLYLLLIGVIYVIYKSRELFLPLSLSLLLIYLILPMVNFFENGKIFKLKIVLPRGIAILITYLIYGTLFVVFLIFLVHPVVKQFDNFSNNFKTYINKAQHTVKKVEGYYLKYNFPPSWNDLMLKQLEGLFSSAMSQIRKSTLSFFKFFSHLIELFFVPIIAFYIILDREKLREGILNVIGKKYKNIFAEILDEINTVIKKYIQGQVILSFIMAVIATILFSVWHIEFALLAGIFAGVTKFIPMVGPFLGWIPAFILALLQSFQTAVWVTIFFASAHFLENKLILPKVMQYYVNLHPVTIIISLLVGAQLGGIVGMFVAVPVTAILKILFFKLKPLFETP